MSANIVYSTEFGAIKKNKTRENISSNSLPSKNDGIAHIWLSKSGRAGKAVAVIKDLNLDSIELKSLAQSLKSSLGVGGTIKNSHIEIQTSDRNQIMRMLNARGIKAILAGG